MQDDRSWQTVKRIWARYDRLMEKQGFYIVLGVCVLVIALSALYTFRLRDEADAPLEAGQEEAQSAAGAGDTQRLDEALALVASEGADKPLTLPTESAFRFTQPLAGFMGRAFSDAEPQYFAREGVWRAHLGVDLLCEYGTPVKACAAGVVAYVGEDNELGLCVRVDHQNGYESLYAGLSDASYARAGDPVARGQTIGHAGDGVLAERDDEPHLHLEARKDGRPVDPLTLFLGIDSEPNK